MPSTAPLSLSLFLLIAAAAVLLHTSSSAASATGDRQLLSWMPVRSSGCDGTVGQCLTDPEEEFELGSEISRRILATSKYISYGALQRNNVPCSRRGASYYNCKKGAQANPYSRGCSKITRCRS